MPNSKYVKGYTFENYLVKDWRKRGYLSYRMYASKPFDFWVMGDGVAYICEAKNWKRPPTERWLRKEYQWLKDMADNSGVEAVVYSKLGRGKDNYLMFKL